MGSTCNGMCYQHRVTKGSPNKGKYRFGQKRCQVCDIYVTWEGLRCPCCNFMLRTKPRNTKFKIKLKQIV
ncbi:hypothetical protein DSQ19_00325 [Candidatus Nitrosotenuis sp. DW1]|nr:hypothetical protein DSQ19_00325 [Candidatus Nitrosotenuis sp. DW1]